MVVDAVDFRLGSFFDELLSIVEPQLKNNSVELSFDLSPDLPEGVRCDRLRTVAGVA